MPQKQFISRKVFVVGTGRSGTHWIGHILESHPDMFVTIEKEPMFRWSTKMARDFRCRPELFPSLAQHYEMEHEKARPKHYADKSHPNLWIAEMLADAFPDALFIGVERNVFATVASMLKHKGVLAWFGKWRKYPLPNKFLGIREDMKDTYESLSIEAKCALRWLSHSREMERLQESLGSKLRVVVYEQLQKHTESEIAALTDFLQLNSPIPVPIKLTSSLDCWKEELTSESQDAIRSIVEDRCGNIAD